MSRLGGRAQYRGRRVPTSSQGQARSPGHCKIAAKAMRTTGKPVGLLMWRGRHAWVMSGFRATADPRAHQRLQGDRASSSRIRSIRTGRRPGVRARDPARSLTVKQLGRQFVPASQAVDMEQPALVRQPRGQVRDGRPVRGPAVRSRRARVRPDPPVGPGAAGSRPAGPRHPTRAIRLTRSRGSARTPRGTWPATRACSDRGPR